jgi:hypothetical protein
MWDVLEIDVLSLLHYLSIYRCMQYTCVHYVMYTGGPYSHGTNDVWCQKKISTCFIILAKCSYIHLHSFSLSQVMVSTSVESSTEFGVEMYNRSNRHLKLDCSIFSWHCPIYSHNDAIREGSHRLL